MITNTLKNYKTCNYIPLIMVFFLLLSSMAGRAQNAITGTITGENDGLPIPGVNIVIKGTANGTITDLKGEYSISVSASDSILIFSSIGYQTEEIPIGNKATIDVVMKQDVKSLEEVVVVGYGTQKKDDLTGAVSVVEGDAISQANAPTIGQALQGRASGVAITNNSGQPGSQTSIKIRGIGSISNSTDPLFVVDGVITENKNILNTLSPSNIQSISILKDASATAIYGARGANGVVVITTKKGAEGKTQVTFEVYTGITAPPRKYDVLNADEYAQFSQAAWNAFIEDNPSASMPQFFTDSARNANNAATTDWQDLILQRGIKQNYNLNLKSGSENLTYMFGLNYYDEKGILVNTGFKRLTTRLNSELKVNDWLKVGETLVFNNNSHEYTSHKGENPWRLSIISSPFMPVYDSTNIGGYAGPYDYLTGPNDKSNPYAEQMLGTNEARNNQIIGNIYSEINPLPGLVYRFDLGVNYRINYTYKYAPEYELARAWNNASSTLNEGYGRNFNYQVNNLLTYTNTIDKHNFSILLGQSAEAGNYRSLSVDARDISFNKKTVSLAQTIGNAKGMENDLKFSSLFARAIYDYDGKYLFTATIRRDGSSRFGTGNRYGYFPSFSLGWKINKDFLKDIEAIELLKLRVGWGQTGNANIGDYLWIDRINNPLETRYPFGLDETVYYGGSILRSFANPDVRWESTEMTNIGIDMNALNNKILFTAEYYYKKQDGMLLELDAYSFFGRISARQPVNIGEITNDGIELNITYRNKAGMLNYSINANFTTINNKVQSLPDGEPLYQNNTITKEGHPIGCFYGWVAERIIQEDDFDESGEFLHATQDRRTAPGDIKFKDLNDDGIINDKDQTIIGKPVPDFVYGVNADLNYGNFDFNIFFEGVYGNDIYNALRSEIGMATEPSTKNWNRITDVLDYWTPENPSTEMTRVSVVDVNENNRMSSWFVEDGSYLRLKNIQLGYTIPENTIPSISSLRIYISTYNIFTLTKYAGLNPEINSSNPTKSGFDSGNYPIPRSYMAGLQINF